MLHQRRIGHYLLLVATCLACSSAKKCGGKFNVSITSSTRYGPGASASRPSGPTGDGGTSATQSDAGTRVSAIPDRRSLEQPDVDFDGTEWKTFENAYNTMLDELKGAWTGETASKVRQSEAYQSIVKMGHPVLPCIFYAMWTGPDGSWLMNFAAQDITGIDMRANPAWTIEDGEDGLSRLWIQWWDQNKNDPKWK